MGRILGKIEYGGSISPRYFIHDDTTGVSLRRVEATPEAAWASYDKGLTKPRDEPAGAGIYCVQVSVAWGRSFVEGERPFKGPFSGFATEHCLLHPLDTAKLEWLGLGLVNGVTHLCQDRQIGFGSIIATICGAKDAEDVELVDADGTAGKPLTLCHDCAATLRCRG